MSEDRAVLRLDESEQCAKCGSYACDCHAALNTDDAIEVACRTFYDDARGPGSWRRMSASDPSVASDYRSSMRRVFRAVSEPQSEPSDAQAGTRGELLSLVKELDYENLSLLSGMTQSELGDRNMRARAANSEDGSGW